MTYYNIYDHKCEENKIATYTGCGNANSTVHSLTKRSHTKKKRCYAVTHINKKTRDGTSKVTTAKVKCFGSRLIKKWMVNAVPEMGFPTSGNGTITGNGSASSSTGNLPVMVLTQTQNSVPVFQSAGNGFLIGILAEFGRNVQPRQQRHQPWWRRKHWDNNDGNDRRQRLWCRPSITLDDGN